VTTETIPAIHRQVSVNVPLETAFQVFTESFHTWWPPPFHIGESDVDAFVLEPRLGGRWYERGVDGVECDWGSVLAWEPPHRVVLGWQINGEWRYDPDPGHASEIEVSFTAEGEARTLVELTHRHIERLARADALAGAVSADSGWNTVLARFADATAPPGVER
jgi:uncharacterized protein YndB with AHSA1/START domain